MYVCYVPSFPPFLPPSVRPKGSVCVLDGEQLDLRGPDDRAAPAGPEEAVQHPGRALGQRGTRDEVQQPLQQTDGGKNKYKYSIEIDVRTAEWICVCMDVLLILPLFIVFVCQLNFLSGCMSVCLCEQELQKDKAQKENAKAEILQGIAAPPPPPPSAAAGKAPPTTFARPPRRTARKS
jgi:hypothetical protein